MIANLDAPPVSSATRPDRLAVWWRLSQLCWAQGTEPALERVQAPKRLFAHVTLARLRGELRGLGAGLLDRGRRRGRGRGKERRSETRSADAGCAPPCRRGAPRRGCAPRPAPACAAPWRSDAPRPARAAKGGPPAPRAPAACPRAPPRTAPDPPRARRAPAGTWRARRGLGSGRRGRRHLGASLSRRRGRLRLLVHGAAEGHEQLAPHGLGDAMGYHRVGVQNDRNSPGPRGHRGCPWRGRASRADRPRRETPRWAARARRAPRPRAAPGEMRPPERPRRTQRRGAWRAHTRGRRREKPTTMGLPRVGCSRTSAAGWCPRRRPPSVERPGSRGIADLAGEREPRKSPVIWLDAAHRHEPRLAIQIGQHPDETFGAIAEAMQTHDQRQRLAQGSSAREHLDVGGALGTRRGRAESAALGAGGGVGRASHATRSARSGRTNEGAPREETSGAPSD